MKVNFPGSITKPETQREIVKKGVKASFRGGVVYRHPDMPPMIEVSGSHYEMGLQYGVLLRPELVSALDSYQRVVRWLAGQQETPYADILDMLMSSSARLASRLPGRFLQELQGMADGSGTPFDTVAALALFYDVLMAKGCTGVLLRGEGGALIHGRNNDSTSFGGQELAQVVVIARHKPDGYNHVTHVDYLFWGGVETGYNNQGLSFSEETLSVREPNPDGFSLPYLARMALEECATLEQLYPLFDSHPTVGAYGTVWGSRGQGTGMVAELSPVGWSAIPLQGPLLWNFNRFYSPKLKALQHPRVNLGAGNRDRESLAGSFPLQEGYSVEDAIHFLRLQVDAEQVNYAWSGSRQPICNQAGQQMMVFDPAGDGLYLSLADSFAARRAIYHVHDDLALPPEPFMAALPLPPVVEKVAEIENRLLSGPDKLAAYVDLAAEYVEEANVHFILAWESLRAKRGDLFVKHAQRAWALAPAHADYRLFAGLAACRRQDMDKAIELLEGIEPVERFPEYELYRLFGLEAAWTPRDPKRAAHWARERESVLQAHDAQEYFDQELRPSMEALFTN